MIFKYYYLIAYSSQSKRRNFINEVIEEEDEDKNKENKREKIKNRHAMNKNKINENIDKMAKPSLIWSNSQFNKKIHSYVFLRVIQVILCLPLLLFANSQKYFLIYFHCYLLVFVGWYWVLVQKSRKEKNDYFGLYLMIRKGYYI